VGVTVIKSAFFYLCVSLCESARSHCFINHFTVVRLQYLLSFALIFCLQTTDQFNGRQRFGLLRPTEESTSGWWFYWWLFCRSVFW